MALTEPDGLHHCTECGYGYDSLTAASECAAMDAAEARQARQQTRHH